MGLSVRVGLERLPSPAHGGVESKETACDRVSSGQSVGFKGRQHCLDVGSVILYDILQIGFLLSFLTYKMGNKNRTSVTQELGGRAQVDMYILKLFFIFRQ